MYPTREQAEALLAEALPHNPGSWENHSRTAAHCAEKIAAASGLDPDKAYWVCCMISAADMANGISVMSRMAIPT